jgi:hypothetical protein
MASISRKGDRFLYWPTDYFLIDSASRSCHCCCYGWSWKREAVLYPTAVQTTAQEDVILRTDLSKLKRNRTTLGSACFMTLDENWDGVQSRTKVATLLHSRSALEENIRSMGSLSDVTEHCANDPQLASAIPFRLIYTKFVLVMSAVLRLSACIQPGAIQFISLRPVSVLFQG